ncbi:MAG: DUF4166 domain-containing protein [Polyangiaceae bacterium]
MEPNETQWLYRLLSADGWASLNEDLRAFHQAGPQSIAEGVFKVIRGPGLLGRMAAAMLKAPPAGEKIPIKLVIDRSTREGQPFERWARSFDGFPVPTDQYPVDPWLVERAGLIEVAMNVTTHNGELRFTEAWVALRLGQLRLKMPSLFTPRIRGEQAARSSNRLWTSVDVAMPLLGSFIHYEGEIVVSERPSPQK